MPRPNHGTGCVVSAYADTALASWKTGRRHGTRMGVAGSVAGWSSVFQFGGFRRAVRRRNLVADALANRQRTLGVPWTEVRARAAPRHAQRPAVPRRERSSCWTICKRIGQRAPSLGGRGGWPDARRGFRVREAPRFRFRSPAQGERQLLRLCRHSRTLDAPPRGPDPRPEGGMGS